MFLELTSAADERLIVNSDQIEHIANLNEGCRITFAAQKVDGRANSILVKETFDQLSSLLRVQKNGGFESETTRSSAAVR